MKKMFLFSSLLGFAALFSGCFQEEEVAPAARESSVLEAHCPTTAIDLMAGQHTNAGTISVSNDLINIYVTYTTTGGWTLLETHLYVG